jgi:hypothetical protein
MAQRKTQRKNKMQKQKGGSWLEEVKQVHSELKKKNRDASLGDAMKEASKRRKSRKN